MIDATLNLVIALPAEAKALNQLLGLKRLQPDAALPLYTGADIALALCGPGSEAAHRGVEFLRRINTNANALWLNIGIAGHCELPLGEALLASQVTSKVDGACWLLSPPDVPACVTGALMTVTEPCLDYPADAACDMEAAGFVAAALQGAKGNRVQVLKIISDNRAHPPSGINGKMVQRLIQDQSTLIRQLVQRLSSADDHKA
jgi:hypothetical protein